MLEQEARITRWAANSPPSEAEILRIFEEESLRPYRWSNAPHDVYSAHTHSYNKVIVVVQGSITFGLPHENKEITLSTGDRLDLPRGALHSAIVGPQGVICLEAHC